MDFGDLKDDKAMQQKLKNFNGSIHEIDKIIEIAFRSKAFEDLSMKDKVNYDLFIAYCLNTLYWMYLRSKGLDPSRSDLKKEVNRVREYMVKAKSAIERHTVRKPVSTEVIERIVKRTIPKSQITKAPLESGCVPDEPPPKRKKFI